MRAKILVLSLAIAGISFSMQAQVKDQKPNIYQEKNYKILGAEMPEFSLKNFDGQDITNVELKDFSKIMFVLFNPSCEHCIDFSKELALNPDVFATTAVVYFAAPGMEDYLPGFMETTGLTHVVGKNIFVGVDASPKMNNPSGLTEFLYKMYDYKLPQINIYNDKREMIYRSLGETHLDKIMEVLSK